MCSQMKLLKIILLVITSGLLIVSCAGTESVQLNEYGYESVSYPYYEEPQSLKDTILYKSIISDYSTKLNEFTIFIDPGHGGEERGTRSRDNSIHEADINLKVANYLKEFLEDAGCRVLMSRTTDETISLDERAELANYSAADILISIHHNSTDDSSNYWTNYSSTFYHAQTEYYSYEPYEHNLAKFIQRDLAYSMRNPGSLASFDGTMSDYLIKDNEGFTILAKSNIPAVLVECAFLSNRLEEQRLNIAEFNKIEAWGIFNGIAKFLKQTIPEISIVEDESLLGERNLQLVIRTSDGYAADTNGMKIYFNQSLIDYKFDASNGNFTLVLDAISEGEHDLKIIYSNRENVYAKPFNRKIIIK